MQKRHYDPIIQGHFKAFDGSHFMSFQTQDFVMQNL